MIPNVSAIYRDLASMADPQSFRSGQPGSNSSSQNNVYAEKQGRHNQLMERLKNAQREMGSINSELNTSHSQPTVSYQESSYPSYRPSYQGQGASRCETQFFSQAEQTQNAGHNWRPPNIRYRHIEDTKPAISIVPQVPLAQINLPERSKNALEKEFYDQPQVQVKQGSKKENGTSLDPVIQEKNRQSDIEKDSELSYGRTWMNRESKFEDKLESYYELCKKRPGSSKNVSKQMSTGVISRAKFQRSAGTKPIGLDLEKAIKMLSFD